MALNFGDILRPTDRERNCIAFLAGLVGGTPTLDSLEGWAQRVATNLAALTAERDRLREALRAICNELGVPGPGYPAPVANAVAIALAVLSPTAPEPCGQNGSRHICPDCGA
ncbi:MAG: hypothetical protein FD189_1066 [Elusimicrobia bacterium]|nr:MAG: hypothetical protein FD189_1066 [Elusimicrobiota bacterium]